MWKGDAPPRSLSVGNCELKRFVGRMPILNTCGTNYLAGLSNDLWKGLRIYRGGGGQLRARQSSPSLVSLCGTVGILLHTYVKTVQRELVDVVQPSETAQLVERFSGTANKMLEL